MTTLAPGNCCNRRSKSLSVETRMKPCAAAYSRILRSPTRASPFRSALSDSGNRSRNNGTSRATGFRRRGASSSGDFGPGCQFGGIRVHGEEVIRLKLGIVGQDLLLGRPPGKPFQNILNGEPRAADAAGGGPDVGGAQA